MKLLEIRKYQNRRYYNTTESRHMSLEEIHRKICDGFDIRVTDAKSGTDITSKVLVQILLEYEPLKLDFFSSELLQQVIRVNDAILKDFFENYFDKTFEAFCESRRSMEDFLRQAHFMPTRNANPFASTFETMNPFAAMFGRMGASESDSDRLEEEVADLRQQIEKLKKQN